MYLLRLEGGSRLEFKSLDSQSIQINFLWLISVTLSIVQKTVVGKTLNISGNPSVILTYRMKSIRPSTQWIANRYTLNLMLGSAFCGERLVLKTLVHAKHAQQIWVESVLEMEMNGSWKKPERGLRTRQRVH